MSKWYEDDDKVKSVFDGIRNYIYCGGILYVGVLSILRPGDIGIIIGFSYILGISFVCLALYLFWVNTKIMDKKLFQHPRKSLKGTVAISLTSSLFLLLGFTLLTQQVLDIEIIESPVKQASAETSTEES